MKLVMTLVVRNEEEILDANLRYHLNRGVDFVIATDNDSSDETPGILERFAREGVLHMTREARDDPAQALRVTRMARMAATDFGADWVINNDADEFWWPQVGTLKDVLEVVPKEYGVVVAPRFNFVPSREESGEFYERSVAVELESVKPREGWLKVAPMAPKSAHRASPEVTVSLGGHEVAGGRLDPVPGWQPLLIFHYQVRSYAQFEARASGGETIPNRGRQHLVELHRTGDLRDFYERHKALSDEAIARGIREGRLCVDRRMRTFMREIDRLQAGSRLRPGLSSASEAEADGLRLAVAKAVLDAKRTEGKRAKREKKLRKMEKRAGGVRR